MSEHVLTFALDGTASTIYADDIKPLLTSLGQLETRRASDVEPDGEGWSAWIRPEGGPLAWLGMRVLSLGLWLLRARGVKLGPYPTRAAALAAETAWLREGRTA